MIFQLAMRIARHYASGWFQILQSEGFCPPNHAQPIINSPLERESKQERVGAKNLANLLATFSKNEWTKEDWEKGEMEISSWQMRTLENF